MITAAVAAQSIAACHDTSRCPIKISHDTMATFGKLSQFVFALPVTAVVPVYELVQIFNISWGLAKACIT